MAFRNNEFNVTKQRTRLETLEIINTVVTCVFHSSSDRYSLSWRCSTVASFSTEGVSAGVFF